MKGKAERKEKFRKIKTKEKAEKKEKERPSFPLTKNEEKYLNTTELNHFQGLQDFLFHDQPVQEFDHLGSFQGKEPFFVLHLKQNMRIEKKRTRKKSRESAKNSARKVRRLKNASD